MFSRLENILRKIMEGHKEYFLDTNIFLRLLVKDDPKKFKDCVNLFLKVREGKVCAVTSAIVLAEIVWTGTKFYKISKQEITEALRGVFKFKHLRISDEVDLLEAVSFYEEYNVKFADCLIASHNVVQKNGAVIISYDRDFDKMKIKRIEPKDLLDD